MCVAQKRKEEKNRKLSFKNVFFFLFYLKLFEFFHFFVVLFRNILISFCAAVRKICVFVVVEENEIDKIDHFNKHPNYSYIHHLSLWRHLSNPSIRSKYIHTTRTHTHEDTRFGTHTPRVK